MASSRSILYLADRIANRRTHQEALESDADGMEPFVNASESRPRASLVDSNATFTFDPHAQFFHPPLAAEQASHITNTFSSISSPQPSRAPRRSFVSRSRRRTFRDLGIGSPSQPTIPRRRSSLANSSMSYEPFYEQDLALALEHELLTDEAAHSSTEDDYTAPWEVTSSAPAVPHYRDQPQPRRYFEHARASRYRNESDFELNDRIAQAMSRTGRVPINLDDIDTVFDTSSLDHSLHHIFNGVMKRPRDRLESTNGEKITKTLESKGAVAVMAYDGRVLNPEANDVWPECRSATKLPSHYSLIDLKKQNEDEAKSRRRPSEKARTLTDSSQALEETVAYLSMAHVGRPEWGLPIELVELIAGYLNRDDIKSLRLVSRELNYFVSQVMFRTVVVPFNTEIYGMLGQESKVDLKGKKRAKIEKAGYSWKNSNVDDVYNGHGLDVFRGFGKHIIKYGMSFEVNEASLSTPPSKSLTEKKTSFWGNYDWPFEEYRRFDAVAGLETAADETPRMKIAFSELSKVKELALSVDSGLGWLNGPDRSIRARVLQTAPPVFGSSKGIPDRREQAQQELWDHIVVSHIMAGSDVRLATLYKMEGQHLLSEIQESNMVAEEQPSLPYMDPHLINKATPYDAADISIPTSFDDPEDLNRFILPPGSSASGVLFSSLTPPTDAGQLMSPVIPANLTKAQKEWLLETEWAQRAFLSSYMLSIIDNPITFNPVHTLTISRLSSRYLSMLNRNDFWASLPTLADVTLMVDPGWRTVYKDEAGFVDTPTINPSQAIDPFVDLLRARVAPRSNIRSLTIGWVVGGEHAEGLHARNRLIMPAPLIRSTTDSHGNDLPASDLLVDNNPNRLRASLVCFPHIERLTLKNCWITPPVLLQFVQIHDSYNVKHLKLDSLSLTAILQPGNANQAAPQQPALLAAQQPALPPPVAAAPHAAVPAWVLAANNGGAHVAVPAHQNGAQNQHLLQIYIQALQMQLQQLQQTQNHGGIQQQHHITALQNQLQQQVQQLQVQNPQQAQVPAQGQGQANWQQNPQIPPQLHLNMANFTNPAMLAQNPLLTTQVQSIPPNTDLQSALRAQPRPGSWLNIIDIISPGNNLSNFESEYCQADRDRITALEKIEFISCGYAKLPYSTFDQAAIETNNGTARTGTFRKRCVTLAPAMLSARWPFLGQIVQEVELTELTALDAGWNLKTGWEDEDEARSVEFDGLLPGGSGRFSGVICRLDRLVDS